MSDDIIKSAPHYTRFPGMEPREIIYKYGLSWGLGSTVSYILRAGQKGDKLIDLKKARECLDYEIAQEEKARASGPNPSAPLNGSTVNHRRAALGLEPLTAPDPWAPPTLSTYPDGKL